MFSLQINAKAGGYMMMTTFYRLKAKTLAGTILVVASVKGVETANDVVSTIVDGGRGADHLGSLMPRLGEPLWNWRRKQGQKG